LLFARHDALEERLQQLQRLEGMAKVVGGLAHDFNNALMVISSHLELFAGRFSGADGEAIADMTHAANAAIKLSRRLLDLGRSEPAAFEIVEIAPLVAQTIAMMRPALGARVAIDANTDSDSCVLGSRDELQQMLINLLTNARDAVAETGRITVRTRTASIEPAEALLRHLAPAQAYVEISVTDNGSGMDPATLERVFEPFFTTKPVGKGTGLGLMAVHATVRRHGGAVQVQSVVGHGTEFTIVFPAVS
jgi:signal transduction histidine kinase